MSALRAVVAPPLLGLGLALACSSSTVGTPAERVESDVAAASDLAIDGRELFYVDGTSRLHRKQLDGSGNTALTALSGTDAGRRLAVGPSFVYTVDDRGLVMIARSDGAVKVIDATWPAAKIQALEVSATQLLVVSTQFVTAYDLAGNLVREVAIGTFGGGAIDDTHYYWSTGGNVLRTPIAGGAVETIGTSTEPGPVAVTASDVFWLDVAKSAVMRSSKNAPSSTVVDANDPKCSALSGSRTFEVDGTGAHWTTCFAPLDKRDTGSCFCRVDLLQTTAGSTRVLTDKDTPHPARLALAPGWVYFTVETPGLYRVAR